MVLASLDVTEPVEGTWAKTVAEAAARHGFVLASRRFAADEVLTRAGESAHEIYLVVSGEFRALVDGSDVGHIGPGELIGEVSALAGGRRIATVVAQGQAEVKVLEHRDLTALLALDPALAGGLSRLGQERIHRTQVARVVKAILGTDDVEATDLLLRLGTVEHRAADDTVYREGEVSDGAYVVLSGRLRRSRQSDLGYEYEAQEPEITFLGPGSVFGEQGLLSDMRRGSDVVVTRDCTLLHIPQEALPELLAEANPDQLPAVVGLTQGLAAPRRPVDRVIAVAVTAPVDQTRLVTALRDGLKSLGPTAHLSSARLDPELRRPDASRGGQEISQMIDRQISHLVETQELNHTYVLLELDRNGASRATSSGTPAEISVWNRSGLQKADVVLVIASAKPDQDEVVRIRSIYQATPGAAGRVHALLHKAGSDHPARTADLHGMWKATEIIHLTQGSTADLDRLARMVAGRTVGLVIGGGGARGFAALGVARALSQSGVPIDAVGGTSVGAALALSLTMRLPEDELLDLIHESFHKVLDYTVPMLSLTKGERLAGSLLRLIGDRDIEDLWLPFFCVSTNLTKGVPRVHRRGAAAPAVRASLAVPGVFPPVADGDDLLVDGGVVNNLPGDLMRRLYPTGTVVAVDAAPPRGPKAQIDYGMSVSGWEVLRNRVRGGRSYPGLVALLMRSVITGSLDAREKMLKRGDVDLLLAPELKHVGVLEFESVRMVADQGYESAAPVVARWLAEREVAGEAVPRL